MGDDRSRISPAGTGSQNVVLHEVQFAFCITWFQLHSRRDGSKAFGCQTPGILAGRFLGSRIGGLKVMHLGGILNR